MALPLIASCGSSAAASPSAGKDSEAEKRTTSLRVVVKGFENRKGQVLVALFSSKKGFPDQGEHAMERVALPVPTGELVHVFPAIPAGRYAVAVLHDENKNYEMDTGFLGMPEEAYGVSNNVAGRFGPPSFADAVIKLLPGKKHRVSITLIYP